MNKIYTGQSSLTIRVSTTCSLVSAESCEIRYIKPDGTEGAFTASVLDSSAGIISYDVNEGDIDQAGWWRFWAHITFTGGRSAPGDVQRVFVRREGS